MTNATHHRALPSLSPATLMLMLLGGAAGTVAFDLWGHAIGPLLGFPKLAPEGLARSLLGTFGLPNGSAAGSLMHLFFVGLIGYPLGWLFVARPVLARILPQIGWFLGSIVYGFGLWVFAIGGVTVIAGLPFFLGFSPMTWSALVGHILYAIAAAAALTYIERSR